MAEYNEKDMSKLYTIQTRLQEIDALPQKVTLQDIVDIWEEKKELYIQEWKQRNYSSAFLEAINVDILTKEKLDEELYNEGIRCM